MRSAQATLRNLALLCGLVFAAGLFAAPERAWSGFLLGFVILAQLGIAGVGFLAGLNLSNASWATALRKVPEAMASVIPYAGALGLVLLLGVSSLYEWSHADVVESDEILQAKSGYLNTALFAVRMVVIFVVWWWFAWTFIRRSRRQDEGLEGKDLRRRNVVTSALFFVAIAITWSVASFDWLMSLEPHWFSTIYALYTLAGILNVGLAAGIILLAALRRSGAMREVVTEEHLHDLGKLLFTFAIFWFYVWYCQYMLIWYSDIPEETSWYLAREAGTWSTLMPANLALNWLIPFVVLMPRRTKRSIVILTRVAWIMLFGHALDLYILAGPPLMGEYPLFGIWEVAPLVGAVCLFFWLAFRALGRGSIVPHRDPHLAESLSYHAG